MVECLCSSADYSAAGRSSRCAHDDDDKGGQTYSYGHELWLGRSEYFDDEADASCSLSTAVVTPSRDGDGDGDLARWTSFGRLCRMTECRWLSRPSPSMTHPFPATSTTGTSKPLVYGRVGGFFIRDVAKLKP